MGDPPLTLAALFQAAATRDEAAAALMFPGEVVSYGHMAERVRRRAGELRALGIGPGERFGILLPNSVLFVELVLAASLVGAAAVPINTRYKVSELRHICRDSRIKALFTTDSIDDVVDFASILCEAFPDIPAQTDPCDLTLVDAPELKAIVLVGQGRQGFVDAESLRRLAVAAVEGGREGREGNQDPAKPILIMYTSGTTANAKGCVIVEGALVANASHIAERFEIPPSDRWWDPLPMFHMGALLLMTAVFSRGATFVSMGHFDADEAIELIRATDPTVLYPLFPTITLTLRHHAEFSELPRQQWRLICNVGPPDMQMEIREAFAPAELVSAYGMTELCGSLAYNRATDPVWARTGTCGVPLPDWDVMVVDPETGRALPDEEPGELRVRGASLFAGYFDNPDLTASSFDSDGYFVTGDLCSKRGDYLLFHGRLKDQLKVGGENVSALEVESFLGTHPAIKLAQVVGIPDDRLVEVPVAFIERAPGATIDASDVIAHCTGQIASFKVPRHVRFVDEWPMSSTKIQKFRLRESLLAELGRS